MSKIYGLSFNGVHCSALGLTLMSAPRPIMAQTKDTFIEVPGMNGSYLSRDSSLKDIEIIATFVLKKYTREDAIAAGYAVGEWLTTPGRAKLIFDDYPKKYYEAKAITTSTLEPLEGFDEMGEITVQFLCSPIMKGVI